MLLAIDLGNTHSVIGLYNQQTLVDCWRISTRREATSDELTIQLQSLFALSPACAGLDLKHDFEGAILSSVVPTLTKSFVQAVGRFGITCKTVGPGLKTGMQILYDNPREVGADRIVNAVAAYHQYQCALCVVDMGTATTFDVISQDGKYLGGAIAPGIGISADALWQRAARLPRVEISAPPAVIGKNTANSMQSGLIYGYTALVDGLVERMREEMNEPLKAIATGGLAQIIAEHSHVIEAVDKNLTLEGLRLLYELNR